MRILIALLLVLLLVTPVLGQEESPQELFKRALALHDSGD
jgi:hypothetical protein